MNGSLHIHGAALAAGHVVMCQEPDECFAATSLLAFSLLMSGFRLSLSIGDDKSKQFLNNYNNSMIIS